MKCIAAVVMMTLAVVTEGGVVSYSVPWTYSAAPTTVVQQNVAPRYVASVPVSTYAAARVAYTAPHTTVVQPNVAPLYVAPVAPSPVLAYSTNDSDDVEATHVAVPVATVAVAQPAVAVAQPAVAVSQPAVAVPQPAFAVAQPAVVAQKEARYVAANRGAVHDAPLAGHTVSQQSLNLAPATGSF